MLHDRREREVDPDRALDDQDQQHRQRHAAERHEQDRHNEHQREDADMCVVLTEGGGKVLILRGLADEVALGIVLPGHALDDGEIIIRLLALDREIQPQSHAGVVLGVQLALGVDELVVGLLELLHEARVDARLVDLALLIQELDHVDERDGGIVDVRQIHELAQRLRHAVVLRAVGGVGRAGDADVDIRKLGKLARREALRDGVAVLCLGAGKRDDLIDAVELVELGKERGLRLVIGERNDERHFVDFAEGGIDLLFAELVFVLLHRVERAVAEHIGAVIGEDRSGDQNDDEDRRDDVAGLDRKAAPGADLRQEALVVALVEQRAHEQQQRRHEQEHREHADQDRLDEHEAHVRADLDLHERQRQKTRNGRQARSADLGDAEREGLHDRVTCVMRPALLGIVVAEDDRIVDRETQLQHRRNGVCDEGDLAEPVVRALVQPDRHAENDQQDRNLGIGFARQEQDQDDDDNEDHEHHPHFLLKDDAGRVADLRIDICIVVSQGIAHVLHAADAHVIQLLAVKRHIEQRRRADIVRSVLLELDTPYAVHVAEHLCDLLRLVIGHV